jgi:hypothetical protein
MSSSSPTFSSTTGAAEFGSEFIATLSSFTISFGIFGVVGVTFLTSVLTGSGFLSVSPNV